MAQPLQKWGLNRILFLSLFLSFFSSFLSLLNGGSRLKGSIFLSFFCSLVVQLKVSALGLCSNCGLGSIIENTIIKY